MNTTSTARRVNRHLAKMDRYELAHPTSQYSSRTTIHELGENITQNLVDCLKSLSHDERKRLLSITNMEVTDTHFRRMLRVACQS